eukprot:SAG22_NODE_7163_length_769_cov_1.419403_1_plen_155_part_10
MRFNNNSHQTFINEVFQAEIRVYEAEGLDASAIKFTDNSQVLEMVSGYNPHKPETTSTALEVKRSVFGHLDTVTNQKGGKVAAFVKKVMDDPTDGSAIEKQDGGYFTSSQAARRAGAWQGWGKKLGGWYGAYDDNGDLLQYKQEGVLKNGDQSKF